MGKEIGIDFGTTNTVVSYINSKGRLRALRYENKEVVPSVVYFISENEYIIGEIAKKRLMHNPEAGIANFKTRMSDNEKYEIVAENGDVFKYKAKKVASLFLNRLINNIEEKLIKEFGTDGCIGNVVITVPAKFNDAQKEATKWAAKEAGFEEVKLATESTAAAIAHRQESGLDGQVILVYDFGGGTFDVSIIEEKNRKFIEIATDGDKDLGGNKLTEILARYLFELINEDYALELPFDMEEFDEDYCEMSEKNYLLNRVAIVEEADKIKSYLSDEEECELSINIILQNGKNTIWAGNITRELFNSLIKKEIERTMEITGRVIQEANQRDTRKIDNIVLAGGSSQLLLVQNLIKERFNSNNPMYADDVSTLISRGAALLANEELSDITEPMTNIQYGIAVSDGLMSFRMFKPIISENQKLPCSGKEYFYLNKDGQDRIEIPYFERDIKNYPEAKRTDEEGITEIDKIIVSNLPSGLKKDEVKIAVEFTVQIDGTLKTLVEIIGKDGAVIKNLVTECEKASNLE